MAGKTTSTGSKTAKKKRQTLTIKKKTAEQLPRETQSEGVTSDLRAQMIAEAAYYRAERRGFDPHGREQDWFEAEKEVDAMLSKLLKKGSQIAH